MSLNYSYKAITERNEPLFCDRDNTGEKEYLSPAFESLIWATMIVGAQADDPKFAQRVRVWEIAAGNFLDRPHPDYVDQAIAKGFCNADTFTEEGHISLAEIKRVAGLTTNASKLTDAQFAKKVMQKLTENADFELNREGK